MGSVIMLAASLVRCGWTYTDFPGVRLPASCDRTDSMWVAVLATLSPLSAFVQCLVMFVPVSYPAMCLGAPPWYLVAGAVGVVRWPSGRRVNRGVKESSTILNKRL